MCKKAIFSILFFVFSIGFVNAQNYIHLNGKDGLAFERYNAVDDFYKNLRGGSVGINSSPSIAFRQIDFAPLKIKFKWCKKVLGLNVCGTEELEFPYGKVISDKDLPENKDSYVSKYFLNITDATAFSTNFGSTTYLPHNYILTSAILDNRLRRVTFLREGLAPWHYDGLNQGLFFWDIRAIKEVGGYLYILDIGINEPKIIVLKIEHSSTGDYSVDFIDKYELDGSYKKLTDITGVVSDTENKIMVSDENGIHIFNANKTTGIIDRNTTPLVFSYFEYPDKPDPDFRLYHIEPIKRLDANTKDGVTIAITVENRIFAISNTSLFSKAQGQKPDMVNLTELDSKIYDVSNLAYMNTEKKWYLTDFNGYMHLLNEQGRHISSGGNPGKDEDGGELFEPNCITPNPIDDPLNDFKYRFIVGNKWGFETGFKLFAPSVSIPSIQVFENLGTENFTFGFNTTGRWQAVEKVRGLTLESVVINDAIVSESYWINQISKGSYTGGVFTPGNELLNEPNILNLSSNQFALKRGWNTIKLSIRLFKEGEPDEIVNQINSFYWLPSEYNPTLTNQTVDYYKINEFGNGNDVIYKNITVSGIGMWYSNLGGVKVMKNQTLLMKNGTTFYNKSSTSNVFDNFSFAEDSKIEVLNGGYICLENNTAIPTKSELPNLNPQFKINDEFKAGVNSLINLSNTNCTSPCFYFSKTNTIEPDFLLTKQITGSPLAYKIDVILSNTYNNSTRWEVFKLNNDLTTIAGGYAKVEFIWTTPGIINMNLALNYTFEKCSKYKIIETLGCNGNNGTQNTVWFPQYSKELIFDTKPIITLPSKTSYCDRPRPITLTGFGPLPENGFANTSASGTAFWSGTNISRAGVINVNAALPRSTPINYTYTYTDLLGCTASATTTIIVYTIPSPPIISNLRVCENDAINFTVSGNFANTYTYLTPDEEVFNTSSSVFTLPYAATLDLTGSYSVTGTLNGCTSNVRKVTVTVNSLPGLNIGLPLEVCLRTPRFVLTAQPNGGTFTGVGVQKVGNRYFFTASVAGFGVHTIVYTYQHPSTKCVNSISKTITVGPIITLGIAEKVCANDAPFFPAVVSPLGGVWSKSGVPLVANLFTPTGANIGSHLLTYNFTSPSGCVNSASKTITVVGLPASPVATNSGEVCENNHLVLFATSIAGATYQWSHANGYVSLIQNPTLAGIRLSQAGEYTVKALKDGCFSATSTSAITLVTVNSLPIIEIATTAGLCFNGTALDLSQLPTPTGGTWTGTGVNSTSFEPNLTNVGINKIGYTYIDSKGCQATKSTLITVLPAPVVNIITTTPNTICATNFSSAFLVADPTGNSYTGPFAFQWAKNGIAIGTATGQSFTTSEAGIYTVSATGLCGVASKDFGLTIKTGFDWIGINTNWNDTKNWCGGTVPSVLDVATIAVAPNYPVLTSAIELTGLVVGSGASLSSSNQITIREQISNNGFINCIDKMDFVSTFPKTISGTGILKTKNSDVEGSLLLLSNLSVTGAVLLKSNTTLMANDKLTLHSDKIGTGSVAIIPNNSTIVGIATVQRWIPGKVNRRYIASPVSNLPISFMQSKIWLTGNGVGFDAPTFIPSVLYYNESALSSNVNVGKVAPPSTSYNMGVAQGFEVLLKDRFTVPANETRASFVGGSSYTLDFKGTLNQGDISIPITYSNSGTLSADGFNFIGNPYPSQIDWDSPTGWTKTNIDNAIYLLDPRTEITTPTSTAGVSVTYINGVSSPNRPNANIIAATQGFYVKANTTNPVLQINENAKSNFPYTAFFRREIFSNFFRLHLNVDSKSDEAVIGFRPYATPNFDQSFDAQKLAFSEDSLSIASVSVENKSLCINMTSELDTNSTAIPLEIKSKTVGLHTLSFSQLAELESGTKLYLNDNLRNTTKEITAQTKAKFYNVADSCTNGVVTRFSIIATKNNAGLRKESTKNEIPSVLLFPNPIGNSKILNVKLIDFKDDNMNISIFGITGNLVAKKNYSKRDTYSTLQIPVADLPSGIYLVEIKSKTVRKIQKIVME